MAEPSILGFYALAAGLIADGLYVSGILPTSTRISEVPVGLALTGVALFVAGLFGFARGESMPATPMCSYGANNAILASYTWMHHGGIIHGSHPSDMSLGIGLVCFGYISLVYTFAMMKVRWAYVGITLPLFGAYALAGLQQMGNTPVAGHYGGYCFFLSAAFALYAAQALSLNTTARRRILPLGQASRGTAQS